MEIILLVALIYPGLAVVGIYYENRRQTDALVRIAKALEKREREK